MTEKRIRELIGSGISSGEREPQNIDDVRSIQSTARPEQIENIIDALSTSGYFEKFDLVGTNIKRFLEPLFNGKSASPYGVYLDTNEKTDEMEFLGIQRNEEMRTDSPEIAAVSESPLTPDQIRQKLSGEFKSVQNLFALMGFSKEEAAKYVPRFLEVVYKMDTNSARTEAIKMGYPISGTTVPSTTKPVVGVPETPLGMAASVVDQIGQWILSDINETPAQVAKRINAILASGQIKVDDLLPYYNQLYKKLEKKLSMGQNPTNREYSLIQNLGHLLGK